MWSPNETLVSEQPESGKDHVGFQAKENGDYRVCFDAAPPAGYTNVTKPPAVDGAEGGINASAVLTDGQQPPAEEAAAAAAAVIELTQVRVQVDWLTGVGARDWDGVAKKDHLRDVAVALEQLELELKDVYTEMLAMRSREETMRDVSERVNAKVAWLSVLSLAISCTLAAWQVLYMKAYFIKKKLL